MKAVEVSLEVSWWLVCRPGKLILFIGWSHEAYPGCRRLEPLQTPLELAKRVPINLWLEAKVVIERYSINPQTCEIDTELTWLETEP